MKCSTLTSLEANKSIQEQVKRLSGFLTLMNAFFMYLKSKDEVCKCDNLYISVSGVDEVLTDILLSIIENIEKIKTPLYNEFKNALNNEIEKLEGLNTLLSTFLYDFVNKDEVLKNKDNSCLIEYTTQTKQILSSVLLDINNRLDYVLNNI